MGKLLPPAPQIAFDRAHPIYDGHCLALAVALDRDLVTADLRIMRGAAGSPLVGRSTSLASVTS